MATVRGREWTWGASPREGMRLSRDLSRILGPVALSVLQHVLAGGNVLERLVSLAREETERGRAEAAQQPLPEEGTPAERYAVLRERLAAVMDVLPSDIVEQVWAAWTSPALDDWMDRVLACCVIDGDSYHDEMRLTLAETYDGLWSVLREQAAFD